jgi:transposase
MRPPSPISPKQCKSLERLVRQTKNTADYKRVQCVWLRAAMDLPPDAIARALGLSVHTVRMVQSRYLRFGEEVLVGPGRGGRHRENLSVEEEDTLLRAFTTRAETGEVLVVSEVKAAYERRIGRKVPKSTVYRLLRRHDWRKVAPRPRHPQADPEAQARFKKNSRRLSDG